MAPTSVDVFPVPVGGRAEAATGAPPHGFVRQVSRAHAQTYGSGLRVVEPPRRGPPADRVEHLAQVPGRGAGAQGERSRDVFGARNVRLARDRAPLVFVPLRVKRLAGQNRSQQRRDEQRHDVCGVELPGVRFSGRARAR